MENPINIYLMILHTEEFSTTGKKPLQFNFGDNDIYYIGLENLISVQRISPETTHNLVVIRYVQEAIEPCWKSFPTNW
jgi:hypothetical protein